MYINTLHEPTPAQYEALLDLACQLSPENLCCDGELPKAEVAKRYRALVVKWQAIEKDVGRTISEGEVWAARVTA